MLNVYMYILGWSEKKKFFSRLRVKFVDYICIRKFLEKRFFLTSSGGPLTFKVNFKFFCLKKIFFGLNYTHLYKNYRMFLTQNLFQRLKKACVV